MKWLSNKIKSLFVKPVEKKKVVVSININDEQYNDFDCNQEGLDMICKWEGFYPKPYYCPAGVVTQGIGSTFKPDGTVIKITDAPISLETAKEWLLHELQQKEYVIEKFLDTNGISYNSNKFSALASFAYNLGCDPITNPSRSLCQALLSGDDNEVCKAMKLYCKARVNGKLKKLNGLVARRKDEASLYLKPC